MKFAIIAAFVVLALAQGSLAQEAPRELEKMAQFFEDMRTKLLSTAQELTESIQAHELTSQAQTFLEDSKTQLEPLAAKIQEQLKPLAASVEEQVRPLATSVQEQLKPLTDSFQTQLEDMFRKLMDQAKAIGQ